MWPGGAEEPSVSAALILGVGGERMGAAAAAAHMALFTAHLEVFGLISAVVMAMVLRGGWIGSSREHENVLCPRKAKGPASASDSEKQRRPPPQTPDPRSASPKSEATLVPQVRSGSLQQG